MNCAIKIETELRPAGSGVGPLPQRRPLERMLTRLDHLAEGSNHLFKKPFGRFDSAGRQYYLPRYDLK